MASDECTDTSVRLPWSSGSGARRREVPHLVIAWYVEDLSRVGQTTAIEGSCYLGRKHSEPGAVRFAEVRPGNKRITGGLDSTAISRRQLEVSPLGRFALQVRNVGRRRLFHNGEEVEECQAVAGDTLMLENTAVLLVDARPPELGSLEHYPSHDYRFGTADPYGMVGESTAAWWLREQLAMAARGTGHVLLLGESGSGKELASTTIHALSSRRAAPLVARNAATMPDSLIDAELFGNARNYPNSGSPLREGLIAAANGGWLLLDEIGELPGSSQAHLLRVLDSGGQYHRLGEASHRVSDFRLIAATNRDPSELKHDLLARLTHRIHVPGLEARRADVPLLLLALLRRQAADGGLAKTYLSDSQVRIDPALVDALVRHRFTHHTRELDMLLNVAISSSPREYLALTHEVRAELRGVRQRTTHPPPESTEHDEKDRVVRAVTASAGNVTKASEALGISRHALHRLLRKHDVTIRRG